MKVKIISDGTPMGTQVLTEQGERLERITSIKWELDVRNRATAVITFIEVPVELIGDAVKIGDRA